jgi:hypothetical protein
MLTIMANSELVLVANGMLIQNICIRILKKRKEFIFLIRLSLLYKIPVAKQQNGDQF